MPSAIVIVKRKCKYMHYCAVVAAQAPVHVPHVFVYVYGASLFRCFVATPANAASI